MPDVHHRGWGAEGGNGRCDRGDESQFGDERQPAHEGPPMVAGGEPYQPAPSAVQA